jgi:DNA-binding LytR/AlgR family response regulator
MSRKKFLFSRIPDNEVMHFRYNHKMECVPVKDIAYIESERAYSMIYINSQQGFDKKLICRSSRFLQRNLTEKGFIRCSRSHLVNILAIDHFCSAKRLLSLSGCSLSVSRRLSVAVFRILLENGIKDVSDSETESI